MTANDIVQPTHPASRYVYHWLKVLIWIAYAYAIYWLSVSGHWGDVWGIMTMSCECKNSNRPAPHPLSALIWVSCVAGIISSLVFAGKSVSDGEFETQWDGSTEDCKGKKISVFLGILLGILYVLLVPFLLLTTIFYGIFLTLSMKWIPGD